MEDWKPNYGGKTQYKKKNRYSQKDGDVVFRILPQPKGNRTERSSDWSKYVSVHFGYKNLEGKARPFQSSQVKRNKEVLVGDPALDRLNELKTKLEAARVEGNAALVAKLSALVGFEGVYNVDNNHYMNVIGLDGNIGLLKIRYTAKQALDEEIKRLQAAGVEPLSFENGRFFVFTRSGKNRDTAFKVNVYTEQVDALTSRQVVHKVTPEILSRLETEGFDLDTIAPKLTVDEISQVVAESDILTGKSAAIDRFIDARWKANRSNQGTEEGEQQNFAVKPTTQSVQPTQVAANNGQLPVTAASKTTSVDQMNDDDFLEFIGKKEASA